MRHSVSRRLAWGLFVFTVAASVTGMATRLVGGDLPGVDDRVGVYLVLALSFVGMGAVGAVVSSRRPENPLGWLILIFGLEAAVTFPGRLFVEYHLAGRWDVAGHRGLAWALQYTDIVDPFLLALMLALFPQGRTLSRRWQVVLYGGVAAFAVALVGTGLQPGTLGYFESVTNPIGLRGRAGELARAAYVVGTNGVLLFFALAACSLILRGRRSRGVERQQIKWVASAAAFMVALIGISGAGDALGPDAPWIEETAFLLFALGLLALPTSIGIAVLKYRLYEIDRIINRTLVYAAVTVLVAGVYLAGVIVLQALLAPLTSGSSVAVAGSTLGAAAAFRPVRGRVQRAVDRRFNRERYDAVRTVESFAARLRDEVDLEMLTSELVAVVHSTVQPTTVSVWLRPAARVT